MNIQTVKHKDTSFISVTSPGDLEIKYLKNNFGFDSLHLDDFLHKTQVPKIEIFKHYILLVLDFPFFYPNGDQNPPREFGKEKSPLTNLLTLPTSYLPQFTSSEKKRRILSSQIYLFIGKDHLVVLHEGVHQTINEIFANCQRTLRNREQFLGEGPVFLAYRIIDAMVDSCFPVVNEIVSIIEKVDRELEKKYSQRILEDISLTRRNIVVFQTMIKPILPLFRQLEEGKHKELNGIMQPFWSNVLDHLQKIWDRLEDSRELIEGISESNESLLNARTNEIISALTIIFTLTVPATVLGTFYGMNILLPGGIEDGSWTFWGPHTTLTVIIIISIASVLFMLLYFRHKKWF